MSAAPELDVQITVDAVNLSAKFDEVQQVLHVGFFAYIRRLGVTHCGVCGKRRVCYVIEVTGATTRRFVPDPTSAAQIVGQPKCAQHSGIR